MPGVRAELAVESPGDCPAARRSAVSGPVTDISWTRTGEVVTEEFVAPEGSEQGERTVHRFERDPEEACVCDRVESLGHPVADVRARDGTLVLTVHLPDAGEVRGVVEDLRDRFGGVEVRRLTQLDAPAETDPVPVDRARLTERQRAVVDTAREMGYFEYPRDANATEVAAALDISPSTFTEHLAAAQSKVFDDLLGT